MRSIPGLVMLLALGCAANYHDAYKAKNPDGYGEAPTNGASLHEALAGLYAPPTADYRRFVSKLDVLRIAEGGPTKLAPAEIDAAIDAGAADTFAVVATLGCRSEVDLEIYSGEKVGWMLLPEGKLASWDLPEYTDRCVVSNAFQPGDASLADLEKQVAAYRDANFPRSMAHVGEYYQKGLAYVAVGRIADAEAMLAAGDRGFDVGTRGEQIVRFDTPRGVQLADSADVAALRRRLATELVKAKDLAK
jgi:hypothetical protein